MAANATHAQYKLTGAVLVKMKAPAELALRRQAEIEQEDISTVVRRAVRLYIEKHETNAKIVEALASD